VNIAGYGDDDKMGDVEYMVSYHTCPCCGEKQETKKYYIPEMDKTLCGSTIMNAGLVPEFELGDFKTVKYHFIEK